MNNSLPDILTLRNNIEFASISQFFHTFQSAFRPWPITNHDLVYSRNLDANEYVFETEDLERMILETSERIRLEDLIVRMLRLATGKRFINASTWQTHFSKEFEKKLPEEENPFIKLVEEEHVGEKTMRPEPVNYFTLPLETRVHLLYLLCEWQLDEPDRFREHLDGEEDAVQWRVDPIGYDKKGSVFWLFDDNRLYKETPKPTRTKKPKVNKKKRPAPQSSRRSSRKSNINESEQQQQQQKEESEDEDEWIPWKLMCASKSEWEQFPLKYADSKNIDEQNFYKLLVNDLIPKIIPVLEEHEKEVKKQEALLHRKRSSRILFKELEALERASSFEPELEHTDNTRSRSSHRIEKKALEKEQQSMEDAARAREARLLERERRIMEREYRAMAREKQQSEEPSTASAAAASAEPPTEPDTKTVQNPVKPKKKYKKKEKLDADGNPIPKKEKLDENGNPIPKKKRGRKPKQKNPDDENWVFDCICGVSGKNLDDGTPMIACEKCSVWQHIVCLQKSGQIGKQNSLDDISFVCHKCEQEDVVDILDEAPPSPKRQKMDQQYALPPLIQSSWIQPSAVRAEPPMSSNEQSAPILPHPTTTTTTTSSSTQIVLPTVSTEQHESNITDSLPKVPQLNPIIQSQPQPIVVGVQQEQQNMPAVDAQHIIQQITETQSSLPPPPPPPPPPVVTAPSAPAIQTAAPDESTTTALPTAINEKDLQSVTSSS